jgi:UPF0716 protein FxsA
MPALLLIVLFIVVPLAELAVIIQVGQLIGIPATIAILLADSILGGVLMRAQGRAAWRRFNEAMQAGRVPHREALDGALVIFGGALLLTPGFLSDVLGLLFLIPPTRAVARRIVGGMITRRMLVGVMGTRRGRTASRGGRRDPRAGRRRGARGPGVGGPDSPRRPYDVEGTASESDVNGHGSASSRRLDR